MGPAAETVAVLPSPRLPSRHFRCPPTGASPYSRGMARRLVLAVGTAFLLACGGAQQKPKAPEPDPMTEEMDAESEPETEEADVPDPAPTEPVSEMGDRPPPIPEAWEPKLQDCEELAEKYEELLLAAEMEKLEKRNLQQKFRASAEQNVRNTAKKGAQTWLQACEDIVGTVQSKPRWGCAFQATTLERFNGCMDGKYDAELEDD